MYDVLKIIVGGKNVTREGKHNTSSQCWLRKDILERHKVKVMAVMYSVGVCNLNG